MASRPSGSSTAEDDPPMSLLFTAIGATLAVVFELSFLPYLADEGARPHLVAALTVIVTIAGGFAPGAAWAFSGGLALDVLAGRPLGSSTFAMLLVFGGSLLAARALHRLRAIAPVLAVPILTSAYAIVTLLLHGILRAPVPMEEPLAVIGPGVGIDTLIGIVLGPLVVAVHDRRLAEERIDW